MLPGLKLSAMGTSKAVHLSPVQNHVRHGLFNIMQPPNENEWLTDSVKSLQRDKFFKNGYSPDMDDPYSVSIETSKGENLQLFMEGDSINCYLDSILLQPQTKHCYRTDNLLIQVISLEENKVKILQLKGKKAFFVALEGETKVGSSTLKDNLGLVLENKEKVEIKSNHAAKILLITEA